MLDAAAPNAKWIDAFCETGAFDADQCRAVLEAGRAAGLGLRLHGNQLGHGPGVQLAVECGCASVDHCTYLTDDDIDALAGSDTVATFLPATDFSTRQPYPDARRVIDAGVTVAIASNCNPGSSYTTSISFCIALAVREMHMTIDEAITAVTLGGAAALAPHRRRSTVSRLRRPRRDPRRSDAPPPGLPARRAPHPPDDRPTRRPLIARWRRARLDSGVRQTVGVVPTVGRARWVALSAGLFGTALVTVGCLLVGHVRTTIPALLLLVPISVAGVLGGAAVGVVVAVVAALAYALAFLPPIGHLRIGLTEDVFVLATFVVVAVLVAFISDARRSRSSARPLDDQRAVLLRGVSHDLRSPLTTIKSVSTDLLDGPDYDSATRAELLNMVVDESDRLDRIVGNLLSVSRIEAGALVPERSACDIGELVATCAHRFERLGGNAARVEVFVEPGLPEVDVDAVQVDQVLTNLVENARRVAPPESSIWLRAWRHSDDFVGVSVDDAGPGFESIDQDEAFEAFRSMTGSSGLGLTVCKAIVEAHGGAISVGRSTDGGGAVTFTVPIATDVSVER